MANVVADTGDAGSNLVAGAGTNSATFTMPATIPLNVESVVATVNNAGGGDTVATLTIKDQSGQVIATKRQDDSIPAGDTGTATFALRLDNVGGGIRFGRVNTGNWLEIHTTTDNAPGSGGINLTAAKGGVWIVSQGQATSQFVVDADFVLFDLGNNIYRVINASLIDLNGTSFSAILSDDWTLQTTNTSVGVDASDNVNVNLAAGKPLTVSDHLGNPIFRVDEDGALHGLTGKALTFDL